MKGKDFFNKLYQISPAALKPLLKRTYYAADRRKSPRFIEAAFIEEFFESRDEYNTYFAELDSPSGENSFTQGKKQFESLTSEDVTWGGVSPTAAKRYYALVRKHEPDTVVETGVCNGISTLHILSALNRNDKGNLYSVDYPVYSDENLPEFREKVQPEGSKYSAIPKNKEPGWIVPDDLRERWELHLGKSQRVLPSLISGLDNIDFFIHDSEHSFPCMMFEYEIAWEWLASDGLLISDDTHFNEAFDIFVDIREAEHGQITHTVKFAQ